nr:bifunctional nuclease family protein [Belliella kenyensis]
MGEVEGRRRLPIVIGMFEAQAIAIEIEKIIPNRPMTHDLFKSFANGFGFTVDYILVSDMQEGVFFAKIVCKSGVREIEIDARPSDAIAIAVRFDAPIFCTAKVMSEAAIEVNEGDGLEPEKAHKPKKATPSSPKKSKDSLKDFSLEKLNQMLDLAISNEDYEKAARIRDEINKRN